MLFPVRRSLGGRLPLPLPHHAPAGSPLRPQSLNRPLLSPMRGRGDRLHQHHSMRHRGGQNSRPQRGRYCRPSLRNSSRQSSMSPAEGQVAQIQHRVLYPVHVVRPPGPDKLSQPLALLSRRPATCSHRLKTRGHCCLKHSLRQSPAETSPPPQLQIEPRARPVHQPPPPKWVSHDRTSLARPRPTSSNCIHHSLRRRSANWVQQTQRHGARRRLPGTIPIHRSHHVRRRIPGPQQLSCQTLTIARPRPKENHNL